jgi:predicted amidohydrolase
MTNSRLTVALGEYDTGWHDPRASLAAAAKLARSAAAVGVDVVVLPEMATTGFTMDTAQAVSIDAPEVDALRRIASDSSVWLIAGVALRDDRGASHAVNASLAINPSGEIVAAHRKQRLFAYGDEDRHYQSGADSTTLDIGGVRLGMFICYELRFPELFAAVATEVDAMVVIANWPRSRQQHWDVLLRARAIENQCYIIGVNRVGSANGLAYIGGSAAYDPWGERVTAASNANGTRIVALDAQRVADVRAEFPFLKDRCVAAVT